LWTAPTRRQCFSTTATACIGFTITKRGTHSILPRKPKRFSRLDRKSTRLNSSHLVISYAVFCLKKKKKIKIKNSTYNTQFVLYTTLQHIQTYVLTFLINPLTTLPRYSRSKTISSYASLNILLTH